MSRTGKTGMPKAKWSILRPLQWKIVQKPLSRFVRAPQSIRSLTKIRPTVKFGLSRWRSPVSGMRTQTTFKPIKLGNNKKETGLYVLSCGVPLFVVEMFRRGARFVADVFRSLFGRKKHMGLLRTREISTTTTQPGEQVSERRRLMTRHFSAMEASLNVDPQAYKGYWSTCVRHAQQYNPRAFLAMEALWRLYGNKQAHDFLARFRELDPLIDQANRRGDIEYLAALNALFRAGNPRAADALRHIDSKPFIEKATGSRAGEYIIALGGAAEAGHRNIREWLRLGHWIQNIVTDDDAGLGLWNSIAFAVGIHFGSEHATSAMQLTLNGAYDEGTNEGQFPHLLSHYVSYIHNEDGDPIVFPPEELSHPVTWKGPAETPETPVTKEVVITDVETDLIHHLQLLAKSDTEAIAHLAHLWTEHKDPNIGLALAEIILGDYGRDQKKVAQRLLRQHIEATDLRKIIEDDRDVRAIYLLWLKARRAEDSVAMTVLSELDVSPFINDAKAGNLDALFAVYYASHGGITNLMAESEFPELPTTHGPLHDRWLRTAATHMVERARRKITSPTLPEDRRGSSVIIRQNRPHYDWREGKWRLIPRVKEDGDG